MLSTIQLGLMPLSFGLLFLLTLLYWGQAAFFSYTKYKKLNLFIFYLSFIGITSLLVLRWVESRHFPLSNLYESLLFLSWSFLLGQLILQAQGNPSMSHEMQKNAPYFKKDEFEFTQLLGVVISPLALISYAFAFLNLPKEMQKATSLVPALQSNWLMMHVTVMILSYGALLCGSILSMAFLLINFTFSKADNTKISLLAGPKLSVPVSRSDAEVYLGEAAVEKDAYTISTQKFDTKTSLVNQKTARTRFFAFATTESESGRNRSSTLVSQNDDARIFSLCSKLDNLSYRMLGLGFPLLTVGILSGAVWANSAWGSYWSWDPKETWALITWLVFAIYLHARITKRWSGQKPAIIATLGFFVVWFSYLGVNLIGTGLHSYGWFNT